MEDKQIIEKFCWTVSTDESKIRLDQFLTSKEVNPTRSQLKKLIEEGYVDINGTPCGRPSKKLQLSDVVVLKIPPVKPLDLVAQPMDLEIVFEDDALIVVNKPKDMVVHPAPGHPDGTLVNGLLHACSPQGGDPLRPGIVHRLDKDTSGLMVVAKRVDVHAHLAEQFHEHSVDRRYSVLVAGKPPEKGEWRTFHGRKPGDRKLFSSKVTTGKKAVSLFEVFERFSLAAYLKVTLKTGRTHQVRVHCYDHGFPVLGDPWYAPRRFMEPLKSIHETLDGQALHAELLGFEHPLTRQRMVFNKKPPPSFINAYNALKESSN